MLETTTRRQEVGLLQIFEVPHIGAIQLGPRSKHAHMPRISPPSQIIIRQPPDGVNTAKNGLRALPRGKEFSDRVGRCGVHQQSTEDFVQVFVGSRFRQRFGGIESTCHETACAPRFE